MKGIPDVLYHGTTGLRWGLIEKSAYMATGENGYIFCTRNIDKARYHGYARYVRDKYSKDGLRHYYEIKPVLKDCIIIGIRTRYLNKEKLRWSNHFQDVWYCYFDNLPLENLFIYQIHSLPPIFDNKQITDNLITALLSEHRYLRGQNVNLNNIKFVSCLNDFNRVE